MLRQMLRPGVLVHHYLFLTNLISQFLLGTRWPASNERSLRAVRMPTLATDRSAGRPGEPIGLRRLKLCASINRVSRRNRAAKSKGKQCIQYNVSNAVYPIHNKLKPKSNGQASASLHIRNELLTRLKYYQMSCKSTASTVARAAGQSVC